MKNLLFLFLFLPVCLCAQDFYWHRTSISIASSIGHASPDQSSFNSFGSNTGGFSSTLGARVQVPLSRRLFFRSGLLLAQRQFTFNGGLENFFFDEPFINFPNGPRVFIDDFFFFPQENITTEVELSTADIPIELGFMISREKVNWYITYGFVYHLHLAERFTEIPFGVDPELNSGFVGRINRVGGNNNLSMQMGGGIAFKVNQFIQLYTEINAFSNLGPIQMAERFRETYSNFSLGLGASVSLY